MGRRHKRTKVEYPFDGVLDEISQMDIALDFLELPSRELFPDYYEVIETPISIEDIREKHHTSARALVADFQLMADNAKTYNDPESAIAQSAVSLVALVKTRVEQQLADEDKPPLPKIKLRAPAAVPAAVTVPVATPEKSPSVAHVAHPPHATTQKQKYVNVLDEIMNFEVDGVRIGEPFLEEVSRKDYPEYYRMIKKVMSLNTVKDNLMSGRIKSMGQFVNQMELVFKNAQQFNDEGSLLYQDAKTLQNHFRARMEEVKREIEEQQRAQHEQQLLLKRTSTPPVKLKIKPPVKFNLGSMGAVGGIGAVGAVGVEDDSMDMHSDQEQEQEQEQEHIHQNTDNLLPSTTTRQRVPREEQLIQEITIGSSRSLYKQVVRPLNMAPLQLTQSWFEHRIVASAFPVSSHTLTLSRLQSAVTLSALLNAALAKKRHGAVLTVNGERVNPVPSIHYAESGKLTSRYELKLPLGLSLVVFEVVVGDTDEVRRAVEVTAKTTLWVQVL